MRLASFRSLFRGSNQGTASGFSLVEILITLAIISLLTALVMTRYGAFNSAVLLKNQAYELALDLREAQVYAISARGTSNEFREEYGIYVSTGGTMNQRYFFWQDNGTDVNPRYENGTDALLQEMNLDNRFYIRDICVDSTVASCTSISTLSISFARPNFDAKLVRGTGAVVQTARIVISPVAEPTTYRTVYVTSTGLITVE